MHVSNFINRFLTIFMLVALPIQSCPAIAVLLCQDNFPSHATWQLSHSEYHANQHSEQATPDSACDDCISCHLVINYNIPPNNSLPAIFLGTTLSRFYPPYFYRFIPELPQHPPKNIAA